MIRAILVARASEATRDGGQNLRPFHLTGTAPGFRGACHRARIRATRWLIRATTSTKPSAPRAHRAQHRFARPAIDLEAGRFLIRAQCRTRLHARLAVELVLVETDPPQMTLHGLYIGRAKLRR